MLDHIRGRRPFGGVVLVSGDLRKILPVIEGAFRAQTVYACVKTSPIYRPFSTFRLPENMQLTELQNNLNTDIDGLSFSNFLLSLGEGSVSRDEKDCVVLPLSIALESDFHCFCRAIFNVIETDYLLNA